MFQYYCKPTKLIVSVSFVYHLRPQRDAYTSETENAGKQKEGQQVWTPAPCCCRRASMCTWAEHVVHDNCEERMVHNTCAEQDTRYLCKAWYMIPVQSMVHNTCAEHLVHNTCAEHMVHNTFAEHMVHNTRADHKVHNTCPEHMIISVQSTWYIPVQSAWYIIPVQVAGYIIPGLTFFGSLGRQRFGSSWLLGCGLWGGLGHKQVIICIFVWNQGFAFHLVIKWSQ